MTITRPSTENVKKMYHIPEVQPAIGLTGLRRQLLQVFELRKQQIEFPVGQKVRSYS